MSSSSLRRQVSLDPVPDRRDDVVTRWPARSGAHRLADWALGLILAGVALGLDLFRLATTSVWGDEAFSVQLVTNPWPVFWHFVTTKEANMLLYHLLLRGWLGFTGWLGLAPSELIVRLPSVAFAVASVAVVFLIGRRYWGRTAGTVAALLYLLSPLQLGAAREARSYSLQLLLICLGWYALLAALHAGHGRRRWWAGFAVAMTLAIYAHLFSGLVLAAQVIAVLALLLMRTEWQGLARRSIRPLAVSLVAIAVALIPIALLALHQGSSNAQVPPATPTDLARLVWNIVGHNLVFGALLGIAVTIAVVACRPRSGRMLVLLSWLTVPVVLSFALTQPRLNLHLFAWGYLVVVVPALCLLAGAGAAALKDLRPRRALTVGLVATAVLATAPLIATLQPAQDFRDSASWITLHYRAGDGLLCTSWSCAVTMAYYAQSHQLPAALLTGAPSPWSWTDDGARPLDQQAVAAYAVAHPRIFLVEAPLGLDWPAVKAQGRTTQKALDGRAILVDQVAEPSSLGPVGVRLYETSPAP